MTPSKLYDAIKDSYEDIGEFITVLDVLFILGKIRLNKEAKVIIYVGVN